MSLGSMLKNSREGKGFSRKKLAELAEVNINSIAKYEKAGETGGQFPPLPMLAKLAALLNLSPAAIFAEVAGSAEDKKHFQSGVIRPLSAIADTFYTFEDIWAGMDAALQDARSQLIKKLPATGMTRKEFRSMLENALPGKANETPFMIERLYYPEALENEDTKSESK